MRSEARREQPDLLHRRSPDFELKHRQGAISYVSFAAGNSRGPTAAEGRQREYAAFGCCRSAGTLPRSVIATCE